jgi:putative endopeptidase
VRELNLSQSEPIHAACDIYKAAPLADIKYYLRSMLLKNSGNILSDAFFNAGFAFQQAMIGTEKPRPREERVIDMIDSIFSDPLGQLYVARHFPPEARKQASALVDNLMATMRERMEKLTWMTAPTKKAALEKLAAYRVRIGYGDIWRTFDGLRIDETASYFENMKRVNEFNYEYMISRLFQKVNPDEWICPPQMVNAYYNWNDNSINFPAAIIQPPFFSMNANDAENYGGIGVVIGHEITHGFDDQGRRFDKNGELREWWTPEDARRFTEKADAFIEYFASIAATDGVHINGTSTLGENLADSGGLAISFAAWQKTAEGKKADNIRDFYLSYGRIWASNIRHEMLLNLLKIDVHSPARWRVNGQLPQIDAWYDAFEVTPENKLYIKEENRLQSIW